MLIEEAKFLLENIDLQSIELNYGSNAIIISPKEETHCRQRLNDNSLIRVSNLHVINIH